MDSNNIKKIVGVEDEELTAAQEAASKAKAEDETLYKIEFKKPLLYDGIEYDELEFDFEALTGNDSLEIEKEMNRMGVQLAVPAFSSEFITRMCARACTIPIGKDAWQKLSIRDWHKLRARARNFLMGLES